MRMLLSICAAKDLERDDLFQRLSNIAPNLKPESLNATGDEGVTALHLLFKHQSQPFQSVELLLSCGADARIADADGRTALHYAAKYKAHDCVSLLIHAGCDILRQSLPHSGRRTPLDFAKNPGQFAAAILSSMGVTEDGVTAQGREWLSKLLNPTERSVWHWLLQFGGDHPTVAAQVLEATRCLPQLATLRDAANRVAFDIAAPRSRAAIAQVRADTVLK